jgi:hypothetical protein
MLVLLCVQLVHDLGCECQDLASSWVVILLAISEQIVADEGLLSFSTTCDPQDSSSLENHGNIIR